MSEVLKVVRRHASSGEHDQDRGAGIRLSGTDPNESYSVDKAPTDGSQGPAIGRQGNDWPAPWEDTFLVGEVNGDRLQDIADTHLNENPELPGRIPRGFHSKIFGILGQDVTGERGYLDDTGLVKANQGGGARDQAYIQHISIPRGSVIARAYMRTVDDSAPIPAVYVGDPSRR